MIPRLVLIVCLFVASTSAMSYNISIAPLVEAIERADALYSEWHTTLVALQERYQIRFGGTHYTLGQAMITVWKDREPPREWSVMLDGHMKQPLLDEIAALIADQRTDLTLRGSTSAEQMDCNHCSNGGICTAMRCGYRRWSAIQITRAANSDPMTDDDLPLLPYLLYGWTDEEMRARWYCHVYMSLRGEDDCEFEQDTPPGAAPPGIGEAPPQ